MIFIDANVPMYLVGADHPNKDIARGRLEVAVVQSEGLATDAEVFQEILHRYVAIERRDAIAAAFAVLLDVVDVVHPVELADVQRARTLVERGAGVSARDAIHAAVMARHGIVQILTFDTGFAEIDGVSLYQG